MLGKPIIRGIFLRATEMFLGILTLSGEGGDIMLCF